MRVKSPLADIDFVIGAMRRDGEHLVFESDAASSLEASVRMDPGDAWQMLKAFFKSPSAIGFALSLPFLWLAGAKEKNKSEVGAARHPFVVLNDPWLPQSSDDQNENS